MAFFQDFPVLENAIIKFQDFPGFPGPVRTLCLILPGLEVNFSVHLQSLASKIFSSSKLVRPSTSKFFPNVWETWMTLTRKRLLVDIVLTCSLSKSLTLIFASLQAFISSPGYRKPGCAVTVWNTAWCRPAHLMTLSHTCTWRVI